MTILKKKKKKKICQYMISKSEIQISTQKDKIKFHDILMKS